MRITKILAILLALSAMTVLAFAFTACTAEEPQTEPDEPDPITTEYTVTFYEDNGVVPIERRTFVHGDRLTFPENPEIQKDGYFLEWVLYDLDTESGEPEEIHVDVVTRNMKVVATYQLMDCLVNIYDSITGEEIYNQYYSYGDILTLDLECFNILKPGYNFLGFTEDGENFVTGDITLTTSVTFNAMYEAIPYTITFFDGDTSRIIYDATTTIYGDMTLPVAPQKDGYSFDGWYVKNGHANERVGTAGDTYTVTGNTDFYAVYNALNSGN